MIALKNLAIIFFDLIDKYFHQKRIINYLKTHLKEINIFLDIGSHKGTYTDLILKNILVTEKLILKTHESDLLEGFDVGFNLAHSLLDLRKPENAKKLYDSVVNLKNYFVNAKRKYDDRIDVYDIMPHEGTDWDIFYKSGKL